jgi:hypothetical protein
MTALNAALANAPTPAYTQGPVLQTMKHWDGVERRNAKRNEGADEIMAAAILEGGIIHWCAKPCRHHNVISAKWESNESGFKAGAVHGFLTKNGRFLNRAEARELAVERDIQPSHPRELFSEDLW